MFTFARRQTTTSQYIDNRNALFQHIHAEQMHSYDIRTDFRTPLGVMDSPTHLLTKGSVIRDRNLHMLLNRGQHYNLRTLGYNEIRSPLYNNKRVQSHVEVMSTIDIDLEREDFLDQQNMEAFIANLVLYRVNITNTLFVKLDASSFGYENLFDRVPRLLQSLRQSGAINGATTLILVTDPISEAEAGHKLHWEGHSKLKQNCSSYIQVANNPHLVQTLGFHTQYQVSLVRTNDILIEVEAKALLEQEQLARNIEDPNSTMEEIYEHAYPRMRNEVNDDAQLQMLLDFQMMFPGSKQLMLTRDRALSKKCRQSGIMTAK